MAIMEATATMPGTVHTPATESGLPLVPQRRFKRISKDRMFQNKIRMPMVIM